MVKPKVRPENRDGGPFYGRKVPREELKHARPEHVIGSGWVWWTSGGDNWGVQVDNGILPAELVKHLGDGPKPIPCPPGRGGKWYATEEDAMAALRNALDATAGTDRY